MKKAPFAVIVEIRQEQRRETVEEQLERFKANIPAHMDIGITSTGGVIKHRLKPSDIAKRRAMDRHRSKRRRR